MNDIRFYRLVLFTNAILPLALLLADAGRGNLGVNPVEFFLRATGVLTIVFLLISLLVTPLRKLTGWNSLIKYRRMLGLFAFFYGCVHLLTYSILDRSLDVPAIAADVLQRPFILVGFAAFLILLPLAVTSTNGMIKRLGGKRWSRLHKLVYAAAVLGVIHFWMIVKSDVFYPAMFGIAAVILLGYRVAVYFRGRMNTAATGRPA